MNDRELLEMAAKAAGINVFSVIDDPIFGFGVNTGEIDSGLWNPLTDDGDRYRLAATLDMCVDFNCAVVRCDTVEVISAIQAAEEVDKILEPTMERAIVRAAAEIGKAMP